MPNIEEDIAKIIYLRVPEENLVLLQGIFESYEGLAIVRTVDVPKSLISIIATKDTLKDTISLLDSIKDLVGWQTVSDY